MTQPAHYPKVFQNPQTLYDTNGNFNYSGVIPSKNDNNNINSSINNLNMSNLLLLQNNRVDQIETKLSKTKLGVNNFLKDYSSFK